MAPKEANNLESGVDGNLEDSNTKLKAEDIDIAGPPNNDENKEEGEEDQHRKLSNKNPKIHSMSCKDYYFLINLCIESRAMDLQALFIFNQSSYFRTKCS
jgi:hypothetical protein